MKRLYIIMSFIIVLTSCTMLNVTDESVPEEYPDTIEAVSARIYQNVQKFPIDSFMYRAVINSKEEHSKWTYYHNLFYYGSHGIKYSNNCTLTVEVLSRFNDGGNRAYIMSIVDSGKSIDDPSLYVGGEGDTTVYFASAICTLSVGDTAAILSGEWPGINDRALLHILACPVGDSVTSICFDSCNYEDYAQVAFRCSSMTEIVINREQYWGEFLEGLGTTKFWFNHNTYYLLSVDGQLYDSTEMLYVATVNSSKLATDTLYECIDLSATPDGVYIVADNALLYSSDGHDWREVITPVGRDLLTLDFIDQNSGWLGASQGICRTSDGGQSWKFTSIGNGGCEWVGLQFLGLEKGYAVNLDGTVIVTENAGLEWRWPVNIAIVGSIFKSYSFTGNNFGMLLGSGNNFQTTDAGATWEIFDKNKLCGNIQCSPSCCNFATEDVGYIGTYASSASELFKTTDGRNTWDNIAEFPNRQISTVRFEGEGRVFAGFMDGSIMYTSGSDTNWIEATVPVAEPIKKIEFSDLMVGWALTGQMHILRTVDAGHSWKLISFDELIRT